MRSSNQPFPPDLQITPTSRWPTTLPEETVRTVLAQPFPRASESSGSGQTLRDASIIVVTFNNLAFTRMCIESVLWNTADVNYELIVIDNGSNDGTAEYLEQLSDEYRHVHVIFNHDNRGFAAANNQGMAIAIGRVLVLLNNDTIVPGGWLVNLLRHLDDPEIGLAGPVTNRSASESQIDVPYETYGGLLRFAGGRHRERRGERFDVASLVMFCVALRRDVWEEAGPLDERFESGLFEDDDYAMRVRLAGYRVVCAEDSFVHHFGQASIGKLAATGEYGRLFHTNRRRWEEKWGMPWRAHPRRTTAEYLSLVDRVREIAREVVSPDATVVIVSKGDDELLGLDVRRAWHFPRHSDGTYAGHYPADSDEAIAQLEALRSAGAGYLIVPSTAFWWLDYYPEFRRHLERHYQLVTRDPATCAVFALFDRHDHGAATTKEHSIA